jgi:hypothetical protein
MLIRSVVEKSLPTHHLRRLIETAIEKSIRRIPQLPDELDLPVSLDDKEEHFTAKLHSGLVSSREERMLLEAELQKLEALGELVFYDANFTETHDLLVTKDFFGESLACLFNRELTITAYLQIALAICEESQRLLHAGYLHCHLKPEFITFNSVTKQAHFNHLIYCYPLITRQEDPELPYFTSFNEDLRFFVESSELIGDEYSPYADPQLLDRDGRAGGYIYTEKRYLIFALGMMLARLAKLAQEARYDHYGHVSYQLISPNKAQRNSLLLPSANEAFYLALSRQLAAMTSLTYSDRPTIESCLQFFKHQLKKQLNEQTADLPMELPISLFGAAAQKQKQPFSEPIKRRQIAFFGHQASQSAPREYDKPYDNDKQHKGNL